MFFNWYIYYNNLPKNIKHPIYLCTYSLNSINLKAIMIVFVEINTITYELN